MTDGSRSVMLFFIFLILLSAHDFDIHPPATYSYLRGLFLSAHSTLATY